jgi:aspartyl-tRNA(Asn)/glutamyl-tRNA(Gln) amidotransferase subunit C
MSLTLNDVEHVAALARLGLTDEEKERLLQQLTVILDNIAILNTVDTSSIPPTAQVVELANVLRDDVVEPSLPQDEVIRIAPRSRDGFLEVRAVLGSDEGEAGGA